MWMVYVSMSLGTLERINCLKVKSIEVLDSESPFLKLIKYYCVASDGKIMAIAPLRPT